jgi:hypothetical protein
MFPAWSPTHRRRYTVRDPMAALSARLPAWTAIHSAAELFGHARQSLRAAGVAGASPCRERRAVRLQLLQWSDISAVGCPNNMGEHVNASEDPRDNILGRRRMRKGPPNMRRECHLVYLSRSVACSARALRLSRACTAGTTHLVAS